MPVHVSACTSHYLLSFLFLLFFLFFFNDTATTEIYTLSLHDALPICSLYSATILSCSRPVRRARRMSRIACACASDSLRSEEHTSELQSLRHLVCRLLLEKKKINRRQHENNNNNYNLMPQTG